MFQIVSFVQNRTVSFGTNCFVRTRSMIKLLNLLILTATHFSCGILFSTPKFVYFPVCMTFQLLLFSSKRLKIPFCFRIYFQEKNKFTTKFIVACRKHFSIVISSFLIKILLKFVSCSIESN